MKRCTYCGKTYEDENAAVCSLDQQPLELSGPASATTDPPDLQDAKLWQLQVLFPALAWLVAHVFLISVFSVLASSVFGLLTALWAAYDCSKLQTQGRRVLGIPFKPVVVLAFAASGLWGFGFIWYLVMRRRIRAATLILNGAETTSEPARTWKCPNCGEANPVTFDSCWNCNSKAGHMALPSAATEGTLPDFPRGGNPWE